VVAHRQYGYFCPGCQHEGVAPLPPELGVAPKLDVSVQAEVVSLHYEYGLSYGQIAAYLAQHCQFPISGGAIAQICLRTAQRTVAAEHELQEVVQGTRVVHMDETTWWTSGVMQYLWLVATAAFSWFRVDPRPCAEYDPPMNRAATWKFEASERSLGEEFAATKRRLLGG